jgi:F0F1-type ATP synthase assembly protein I
MSDPQLPPQATNEQHAQDVSPVDSSLLGLGFAWELGYTIAIPAVLFGFGGGYLDRIAGTSPLFLLIGIAIAFTASAVSITKKIRIILNRLPKVLPKKPEEDAKVAEEHHDFHDFFRPPK